MAVLGLAGAAAGDAIGGKRKGAGSWEEYFGVEKYNKNDPVFAVATKVQELFGA